MTVLNRTIFELQGEKRFYCVRIESRPIQSGNGHIRDITTEAAYRQLANAFVGWIEAITNDGRPQPFSVTIEEVSRKNPEDVHTSVTITTIDRGTASPTSPSTIKTVQYRSGNAYATFLEAEQNYVAENRERPQEDYMGMLKIEARARCIKHGDGGEELTENPILFPIVHLAYASYCAAIEEFFPQWDTRYRDNLNVHDLVIREVLP